MKLEFIGKTDLSGDSNCPAGYKTDRGTVVVQGWQVPADVEGVQNLGDTEGLVEVPVDVIRKIAAAL